MYLFWYLTDDTYIAVSFNSLREVSVALVNPQQI